MGTDSDFDWGVVGTEPHDTVLSGSLSVSYTHLTLPTTPYV